MELNKLKEIVERKLGSDFSIKNRKRELIYAKKLYIRLAYNSDIKNTFEKISDILETTHATVLFHYNTFHKVYDSYKIIHDEIMLEYEMKGIKAVVKKEIKVNEDRPKIKEVVRMISDLSDSQIEDLIKYRVQPFMRMNFKA